ncbi:MAG: ParB N-terminal domain-containing protein, partial [Gammaproteobacteria bacterium]|nr:ParB N-terminal domain-containing protein [Gammaproteobacteria bacterium]
MAPRPTWRWPEKCGGGTSHWSRRCPSAVSSQKKRGLGRGLDALLGLDADAAPAESGAGDAGTGQLRHLPVDVMQRGQYQPRTDMHTESLEDLAESIRQQGIVQPIVVRPLSEA